MNRNERFVGHLQDGTMEFWLMSTGEGGGRIEAREQVDRVSWWGIKVVRGNLIIGEYWV